MMRTDRVRRTATLIVGIISLTCSIPLRAELHPGPNDVYIRIVDTGAGLCSITRIPGDPDPYFMVYDAGHWTGSQCIDAVREIVGDSYIDLMVISHSDSDHHGQASKILEEFRVANIIVTGERRETETWKRTNSAIAEEAAYDASIMNLQTSRLIPGTMLALGDATVTLIAGWPRWEEPGPTPSELRNAISIVVKLTFAGHSILLTGDTVGRRKEDPDSSCKDAEKVMVERAPQVPLKADILTAPHHGGNNGSSTCFIAAVDPKYVIFTSGHEYGHPTEAAAQRYLSHGVPTSRIFRTDRGDDEDSQFEWKNGETVENCRDPQGDDDIDVVLRHTGVPEIAYRQGSAGECDSNQ
jgi:beta-lactamase superfamily II metal-dependent hydrolase